MKETELASEVEQLKLGDILVSRACNLAATTMQLPDARLVLVSSKPSKSRLWSLTSDVRELPVSLYYGQSWLAGMPPQGQLDNLPRYREKDVKHSPENLLLGY